MVDGFKDDKGKFRPIDRSAVPKSLTVRELLPRTDKDEDIERQSKRLGKFAKLRASQFGKGAKVVGGAIVVGAKFGKRKGEEIKQKRIEKGIVEEEFEERLEKGVDDILDEEGASDSRKFRRLQRFTFLNRKLLSKLDLKIANDTLKELAERIEKDLKGERAETGGMTQPQRVGTLPAPEGINTEQFEKLPEPLKEQVRLAIGG